MPKYPLGPNHWHVVVHYRGTRVDREVKGSAADADAYEARLRVKLEAGRAPEFRTVPTFFDFCVHQYKPHAQAILKTRTYKNREYQLATLIAFFGTLKINEIDVYQVTSYRDERLRNKIENSTINDDVKVLKAIQNYARIKGYPVQSLETLEKLREVQRRVFFWTTDQAKNLLDEAWRESDGTKALYGMVLFMLNTGCRKGEAMNLEWSMIDAERRMITIQPNDEWQPKDGAAREIPMSPTLVDYFDTAKRTKRYVFVNRKGERYAYWPQRAFDEARKQADLSGGPHTCRHTFAAHFLKGCPDLSLLAEILGDGEDVVRKHYRHLLPEHLERARGVVSFGDTGAIGKAKAKWTK